MALGLNAVPVPHGRLGAAVKGNVCEMLGPPLVADADRKASSVLHLDIASAFQKGAAVYRDQASALIRPGRGRHGHDKTGTANERERCGAGNPGIANKHSIAFLHTILAVRSPPSSQLS
jgi:hypothetical protein